MLRHNTRKHMWGATRHQPQYPNIKTNCEPSNRFFFFFFFAAAFSHLTSVMNACLLQIRRKIINSSLRRQSFYIEVFGTVMWVRNVTRIFCCSVDDNLVQHENLVNKLLLPQLSQILYASSPDVHRTMFMKTFIVYRSTISHILIYFSGVNEDKLYCIGLFTVHRDFLDKRETFPMGNFNAVKI